LFILQIDTSKDEEIAKFINLMLFPCFTDENAFLGVNMAIDFWQNKQLAFWIRMDRRERKIIALIFINFFCGWEIRIDLKSFF
jgi:hypothetical protein